MLVPLRWLSEWVPLPASIEELTDRLTYGGLEIEGVEQSGPDLSGVRVGHVLERGRHPNADRLSVCSVDIGEGDPVDIVCGAPNVDAGQKVAVVSPGAVLPDGTRIKKTKLRGVVSHGMICSERELGLGEAHEGILVLDPRAEIGSPLARHIDAGEAVLDVEITPNRGDWVSMLGMAREVHAHFGGTLTLPETDPAEGTRPASQDVRIAIEDREGCQRYVGRVVRGVTVGASPDWLVARLESAGMRAINSIVDVTNLVMLEFGQPLHAFDLATLRDSEVRVRGAAAGEKIVTLDGQTRVLETEDLVIADSERAIAIAGVMGGAETEVRPETRDILIEAAQFQPSRVRRTARRLGIPTDASYRFERGVDPEGVRRAADRAALLIQEIAGGQVSHGAVEALGEPPPRTEFIDLDPSRVDRLLGTDLGADEIVALLERVGIASERRPGDTLRCRIPSWRNDIHIYQDLIEEVARVFGYQNIPPTMPSGPIAEVVSSPLRELEWRASDSLCAAGLTEVMSFPGQSEADLDALGVPVDDALRHAVRVHNPVFEAEPWLRTTLLPSLLRVARLNLSRQADRVRVFHVGTVFLARPGHDLPDEPLRATALITRGEDAHLWDRPRGAVEIPLFFEAKGIAERLLRDLGLDFEFLRDDSRPWLHPGAASEVVAGGTPVGAVGELHPAVASRFELEAPCAVVEVDLAAVSRLPRGDALYREVSRHPQARRDLAVLIDRERPAGEILEAVRRTGGDQLISVELFDRYEGKGIPEDRVSIAFRMVFQRPDRTLQDAEVSKMVAKVVRMLSNRFGAVQR